jgi:hypothetical protein
MFKSIFNTIFGLVIFFLGVEYLTSSWGGYSEPAPELTCDLPSPPAFLHNIPADKLRLRELGVIAKSTRSIKDAEEFYSIYENELRNYPHSLTEFKDRFDTTSDWKMDTQEKNRWLSMHKENYEATCANYVKALTDKYARLSKSEVDNK